MKYWVQFLTPSATDKTKLVDACGDTSVFILDGRKTVENMRRDALRRAQSLEHWKKYAAYRIVSGPRLFEEKRRGPLHILNYPIQTS